MGLEAAGGGGLAAFADLAGLTLGDLVRRHQADAGKVMIPIDCCYSRRLSHGDGANSAVGIFEDGFFAA